MSKQSKTRVFSSFILLMVAMCLLTFAFVGCNKDDADYKVGILQFVQHGALDQANQGFKDKLKELVEDAGNTISFVDKNGYGMTSDAETAAGQLVNGRTDLIYAIATPAAQIVLNKIEAGGYNIPMIYNAVTDPVEAKLATSREGNEKNTTGCSDLAGDGLKLQFELMLKLKPNLKTIGFMYSSNEVNSQVQLDNLKAIVKEYNTKNGTSISINEQGVSEAAFISETYTAVAKNSDIIYLPTDNMMSQNAKGIYNFNMAGKKLPIVCGEIVPNEICGVATYGVSYYKLGQIAAQYAYEILTGEKEAKDIPFYQPNELDFSISENVAKDIGFEIPEAVKALKK